ncbi:hypothetical protein BC828DRAFT_394101 [Blastocladiella britannica]|nr:hypothetical protein BC828DRAFT_394101 [Blastocladiella britannica]
MKSGPQFIYSGESLFFGPTLVLFCSAFLSAKKLLDIRRSKYYAAFMVLTVLRMLDVCISSYVWSPYLFFKPLRSMKFN